ncbi:hypothetical protein H5158_06465 [Pseudoalteromonas sp. SR45-6]|uniref:hypothetical protein n=1 Tax=Pseudoalteromonas sp. SR45-6 TaxID=2760927 RepID=UPI0015FEE15B|nr:hypothetical protein [Pseudoalteromonas sp. SR45-6]MBB1341284.1 hypothetical protein [Pseudoalteromonas sp. SR45-6]
MSASPEQINEQLIALECRSNFRIKNITEYMLPKSKEAIYLHIESGQAKLVLRPALEVFSDDFNKIAGVNRISGFFHSSEMTRFPTRIFKSTNPIHYGIGFKMTSVEGAKEFISQLVKIING